MIRKTEASDDSEGMSIGELARATGVKSETIRFYENEEILPEPARRGRSGYRTYRSADVERLLFVRRARDLGFSLDQVRDLLSLAGDPAKPCADVDALARANLQQVEEKIAQLQDLQRELSRVIDRCRGGLAVADCQILRVLGRSGS